MRGEKKERKMGKKMRETLSKDKVKRIFCKGERERERERGEREKERWAVDKSKKIFCKKVTKTNFKARWQKL